MQPFNEIAKEIGAFWIFLGIFAFFLGLAVVIALCSERSVGKAFPTELPIYGIITFVVTVGLIFYSANGSVKRRKESDQARALYLGQLAAQRSSPLLEEKSTITIDKNVQSLDGIIGYLDQSIKMGKEPKDLTPIILVLAKEIKNVRDGK